jgi:transposase
MMRYQLTDEEWTAIKPMLPNKPVVHSWNTARKVKPPLKSAPGQSRRRGFGDMFGRHPIPDLSSDRWQ